MTCQVNMRVLPNVKNVIPNYTLQEPGKRPQSGPVNPMYLLYYEPNLRLITEPPYNFILTVGA